MTGKSAKGRTRTLVSIAVIAAAAIAATLRFGEFSAPAVTTFGDIAGYVFVPSTSSPDVTLVDVETDTIAGTITFERQPDQVLVSEAAIRVIARHAAARSLTVFDLETQQAEASIELPHRPETMVMSPDGWLVATADPAAGSVSIVALAKNAVHGTVNGLNAPANLTFSDDGSIIYVADAEAGAVQLIDIVQKKVIGSIDLNTGDGGNVNAAAMSALTRTPNGRYGVCALPGFRMLSVLDLSRDAEMKTLHLGSDPSRPYGTADGRYLLVANNGDSSVTIVDTDTFDIAATVPGATDVVSINTGYFETVAFVVSASENKAVVLDLMDLKSTGDIALTSSPGPGVVTDDGLKMYVALTGSDALAVIDTEERRLVKTIENVGHSPRGVTMASTNNYCH